VRLLFPFVLIAAVVIAAACDSGSSDGGDTPREGALIMTRPDGVFEFSLETEELTQILQPADPSEFYLDVAASPDGSRIAYVVQPPAKIIDGLYDAGSDLWTMNRDGTGAAPLFLHEQPNQLVRYPQWFDANTIYAIIQEIDTSTGLTSVDYTVQKIDVATGARERVLDDALVYGLSPDGAEIAFARLDPQTGESLMVAPAAGGAPRTLLEPSQRLQPFNSPRYSPDGLTLAFASAEQPPLPSGARQPLAPRSAGRLSAPPGDGLPQDIFVIDPAGGEAALLATLEEDFPSLAWDSAGAHIYVLGASGRSDVDVATGRDERIGEGAFHGSLAWVPDPAAP
jgi:Tol biopolymer transport system component